jgi:hypothetical protein
MALLILHYFEGIFKLNLSLAMPEEAGAGSPLDGGGPDEG